MKTLLELYDSGMYPLESFRNLTSVIVTLVLLQIENSNAKVLKTQKELPYGAKRVDVC